MFVPVREDAGVAVVDAGLPAELGAERQACGTSVRCGLVDEIGLVEEVVAVGLVIVGRAVERSVSVGSTAPASVPLPG